MPLSFGPRRGQYLDITEALKGAENPLTAEEVKTFESFDLFYRSLCGMLFNYVPTSGHPGGSISSGRIVAGILFDSMDYDVSDPDRDDADIISYAAGHKAMGLYSLWALRNEVMRLGAPELLPAEDRLQLRLEDLLGFRRNPITSTPLFLKFKVKPLDGHPTPATPFVRLSTGASGVGLAASVGLALGARDYYGTSSPRVHVIEGEGGMTPGRISEALAAAGTASLDNIILHIDWNQASIDSNHVCRDSDGPGEYVQWDPVELAYLHDWNVIFVPDGKDFQQIVAAQRKAMKMDGGQPTAIVYRTVKGWRYGMEGKVSHGGGHGLCTDGFFAALEPFLKETGRSLPICEAGRQRCGAGAKSDVMEACLWDALTTVRDLLAGDQALVKAMAQRLRSARDRLDGQGRRPRTGGPDVSAVFRQATATGDTVPEELLLTPGKTTTLRGELGRVLQCYNKAGHGALLAAAADLLGSTSVSTVTKGFGEGFYNAATNPDARTLSVGGICEDAMSGILAGISTYGHHMGVGSSYGAFIAALGHISARLHAIGNQARQAIAKGPYRPFVLVCAHAGLKTGEDGPTHADPQALQLLQDNFPKGTVITLTPWDPGEIWSLVSAALARRPAVIAPFVTRPAETVLDRKALGLAPITAASQGLYLLRKPRGKGEGTIVLQGSDVAYAFVEEALPKLEAEGIDLHVYYVASAELFDLLPASEQESIYPEERAREAMGITGFTLPTMYRWICSRKGRAMTLYPFQKGHYLGSGQAQMVLAEAGLDGESQYRAVIRYVSLKSGLPR